MFEAMKKMAQGAKDLGVGAILQKILEERLKTVAEVVSVEIDTANKNLGVAIKMTRDGSMKTARIIGYSFNSDEKSASFSFERVETSEPIINDLLNDRKLTLPESVRDYIPIMKKVL